MRSILRSAVVVFAIAAAVLVVNSLMFGTATQRVKADTPQTRQISVSGVALLDVAPDIAYIQVGVDIHDKKLSAALTEANTKMSAIIDALKKAGIPEADIQTVQFNVYRQDDNQFTTYEVINLVRVTVRKIDNVGDTLDTAFAAGANNTTGIQFGLSNAQKSETEARKAAFENANSRAAEIAGLMGVSVGQIISISDSSFINADNTADISRAIGQGTSSSVVNAGKIQISVTLSVSYEVK